MTHLEKLQAALPQLEGKIKSISGAEFKLYAEESSKGTFSITSDNLADKICNIASPIFKELRFNTWGGKSISINDKNIVCFFPKVKYRHWNYSSNGTDYIWSRLFFDLKTGEFDFENSQLIYKKEEE